MKKFYFPKSLDCIDSKGILFNREHFTWYHHSMCWPFDFSIVILGVIFDTFYTSFGYRSWDVGTGTSKFCIKVYFNGLFWMKIFDLKIFVGFGWFWPIWARNNVFLQEMRFKGYVRKFIPSARNELQSWKLAGGCSEVFPKTYERRNFDFF